jgi:GYF domain 2
MSEWHVFANGEKRGPETTDAVVAFLRNHDPAQVQVWREGFDGWKHASEVLELMQLVQMSSRDVRPAPPNAVETPAKPSVRRQRRAAMWAMYGAIIGLLYGLVRYVLMQGWLGNWAFHAGYLAGAVGLSTLLGLVIGAVADTIKRPKAVAPSAPPAPQPAVRLKRSANFVVSHWRGDLPLWVSFWVISVLGNVTMAIISIVVSAYEQGGALNPRGMFGTVVALWTCTWVIAIWQIVGLWRSARNHMAACRQAGRSPLWGGVAQVVCAFAVLGGVATFLKDGVPQLREVYLVAFADDPELPGYGIRVMRDGAEAEIAGGFKYGLTDEFARTLDASPQVKVVHLDSLGGRLGEGRKLFDLIRERGLSTFVSSKCLSACTLAFAGGRERFLQRGAVLGFHRGSFAGAPDSMPDDLQAAVFRVAGFDGRFIEKALSTSHKDMWEPSERVLLDARVVTQIVGTDRFAFSGLGTKPDKERLARRLASGLPVLQAMREREPEQFAQLVDAYHDAIMKGRTQAETIALLKARFLTVINSKLPLADDDVIVDYATMMVDQFSELKSHGPRYCYAYASGTGVDFSVGDYLSASLRTRESDLHARVVRTAAQREQPSQAAEDELWNKVHRELAAMGVSESGLDILKADKVESGQHGEYCSMAIAFFKGILRLPQQEAAVVMRGIFAAR